MATYQIVKLKFLSPLHLSKGQTNELDTSVKTLHSDTIKSALYAVGKSALNLSVDAKSFFDSFVISSAFVYRENKYFFPKPMLKLPIEINGLAEAKLSKKMKKIEYIEKTVFEKIINGQKVTVNPNQISADGKFLANTPLNGDFKIYETQIQDRVAIPQYRQTEEPVPYSVERLYFNTGAGMYFFIKYNNSAAEKEVMACLNLLGENGIGTYTHSGNGNFEYTIDNITMNLPGEANFYMNLSLFLPQKGEITPGVIDNDSAYQVIKRGGYIAGSNNPDFIHLRKKSIYMFEVGSIFKTKDPLKGKIENLKPDYKGVHDVWRDGNALFIPVKKIN